jgi:uracil-DNA glycosylase family protein
VGVAGAVKTLAEVRGQARWCTRCSLYRRATQTVFGDGPAPAGLMLVGEQPGDQEDRQGRPFVGPAGRILAKALAAVGMDRSEIYVTNAVKHFKNVSRGKRRIHQKPTAGEIDRCKWWLDLELKLVRPQIVIALGGSAGRALLGRPVKIEKARGHPIPFGAERWLVVTIHPSLLLRIQDAGARAEALGRFIEDLNIAKRLVSARGVGTRSMERPMQRMASPSVSARKAR